MSAGLVFVPISIRAAKAFVKQHHRHNPTVAGARTAISLHLDGRLIGVGMLGNPKSRELAEDPTCAEAVRVCVVAGAPKGACSKISARLKRIWQLHGGRRFVSYNRVDETGASMRGAGMVPVAVVRGREWDCPSRPRDRSGALVDKMRWEQALAEVPA